MPKCRSMMDDARVEAGIGRATSGWRSRLLHTAGLCIRSRTLLQDLLGLGVCCHAMLKRLAQLDAGGGEPQAFGIVLDQPAFDHALPDDAIAMHKLDALVDAVQHIQQGEVFERNRVHDRPGS